MRESIFGAGEGGAVEAGEGEDGGVWDLVAGEGESVWR